MTYNNINTLLRLGFLPDLNESEEYLTKIIDCQNSNRPISGEKMCILLEEIVYQLIEERNPEKIIIPLTSGFDSRALLAAALKKYSKDRIICVTYGEETNSDVRGAKITCSNLGVTWKHLNPNNITWEIDNVVTEVKKCFQEDHSYCSQEIIYFAAIDKLLGENNVVLSGYFGDAISGAHISKNSINSKNKSIKSFLNKNETYLTDIKYNRKQVIGKFELVINKWSKLINDYPGFVYEDILDFGFRQALRIKGSMTHFKNVVCPFEAKSWVNFWFSQPLENRINQQLYVKELQKNYPDVFCLPSDRKKAMRSNIFKVKITDSLPYQLKKYVVGKRLAKMGARGSFTKNESMKNTYHELLSSLDDRNFLRNGVFTNQFNNYLMTPTRRSLDYILQGAKVEVHLQAGTL